MKPVGSGAARQMTQFKDGRLLFPSISYDGKTIVLSATSRSGRSTPHRRKTTPVKISLRGAPASPGVEHLTLSNQFGDLALSRDGKKIAFIVRGDVFAASSKDGGNAARITSTPGLEADPTWAPDNQRVTLCSYRNGRGKFSRTISRRKLRRSSHWDRGDYTRSGPPTESCWHSCAGGSELRVYDATTKQERVVAKTASPKPPMIFGQTFVWSPDSKWIAYTVSGTRRFRNIEVVSAEGGTPIPVSFVPNVYGSSLTWSPDGTYLLFDTGQRTEPSRSCARSI